MVLNVLTHYVIPMKCFLPENSIIKVYHITYKMLLHVKDEDLSILKILQ